MNLDATGINSHKELLYQDLNSGPVMVRIPHGIASGAKLTVSERTLYSDSFNENLSLDTADAGNSFAFTWFDNDPVNNMHGDWIGIVNVDTTDANVDVFVSDMATPKISKTVGANGGLEIFQIPTTLTNGPVVVKTHDGTGGQKLVVSQRVIYKNSFNELMGRKQS